MSRANRNAALTPTGTGRETTHTTNQIILTAARCGRLARRVLAHLERTVRRVRIGSRVVTTMTTVTVVPPPRLARHGAISLSRTASAGIATVTHTRRAGSVDQ